MTTVKLCLLVFEELKKSAVFENTIPYSTDAKSGHHFDWEVALYNIHVNLIGAYCKSFLLYPDEVSSSLDEMQASTWGSCN